MSTTVANLLTASHPDSTEELTTLLESLPSYGNLTAPEDESAIFDEENEPSTGLINLIRTNSGQQSQLAPATEPLNPVSVVLGQWFFFLFWEMSSLFFLSGL